MGDSPPTLFACLYSPRHTLPGLEEGGLPCLPHTSGVQYIAACNCGRRQANREDPFRLMEANLGFYVELKQDCCKDLEHVAFPEHSPAKGGLKDISLEERKEEVVQEEQERAETPGGQDETSIILETLEHLHLNSKKAPEAVASLLRGSRQDLALPHMKTLTSPAGSRQAPCSCLH